MSPKSWLMVLALATLAVFGPGLADPYQTPRLVALAALCVLLLLRRRGRGCVPRGLGALPALAAGLWLLSALRTRDVGATLVGSYLAPFDGFAAMAVSCGLFVGVARLGISVADAAAGICWGSLSLSLYAIAQVALGTADPFLPGPLPNGRVIATMGNPVYLGAVLAVVCAVAAAVCVHQGEDEDLGALGAVALGLGLVALWLTQTRGAVLAVAVAAIVLAPGRARWALLAGLPLLLLHPRLHAVASDLGRLAVWRAAWAIFRAHPLLGGGPGTFSMAVREVLTADFVVAYKSALLSQQHAHNQILQVLATTGLVGLAAYGLVLATAWRVAALQSGPERAVLAAAGAAYAAVAMFNPVPHAATVLMCLLFGAAASYGPEQDLGAAWIPLLSCLVALVLSGRVMLGDWHYANAVRAGRADLVTMSNELGRAAEANPWEMRLMASHLDAAEILVSWLPEGRREEAAAACVRIAHDALERHPYDSYAHEAYGKAILLAAMAKIPGMDPGAALEEYERAQELAPTFTPLMLRRRALARALSMPEAADRADRELAQIRKWEAGWL